MSDRNTPEDILVWLLVAIIAGVLLSFATMARDDRVRQQAECMATKDAGTAQAHKECFSR